jgi:hypothetical protein
MDLPWLQHNLFAVTIPDDLEEIPQRPVVLGIDQKKIKP